MNAVLALVSEVALRQTVWSNQKLCMRGMHGGKKNPLILIRRFLLTGSSQAIFKGHFSFTFKTCFLRLWLMVQLVSRVIICLIDRVCCS